MTPQEESPLELVKHQGDTEVSVWKRRVMFALMIALCIAFAAPMTCGSGNSVLGGQGGEVVATFQVRGRESRITQQRFERTRESLAFTARVVGTANRYDFRQREKLEETDFWTHMMLADAAAAEGIHVTDQQITDALIEAGFQTAGRFDAEKYRQFIRGDSRSAVTHEQFTERVREILAIRRLAESWQVAATMVPSKEVFDEWKKLHPSLTVDYVVQPFAAFRAKSESEPITDADLTLVAELPEVRAMRAIPARRGYEAASIRLRDVTDEQIAALTAFVEKAGLIPATTSLDNMAFQVFYGARTQGDAYSREAWIASQTPAFAAAKVAWADKKAAWDKEHAADPKPFPDAEPEDPARAPWPEKPSDQFDRFWIRRATAEVLIKETLRHLVLRAERESKSLAALAPDYAPLGVRFHATTEPVADDRIAEEFPAELGRLSDLGRLVRTQFVLKPGESFAPRIHPEPVCTTAIGTQFEERGHFVVRWTSMEDARMRPVAEVKDQVVSLVHARRASNAAVESLDAIRKKAEAAQGPAARAAALREAAAAAGAEVRTLREFNDLSWRPRAPETATTDAEKARAEFVRHRNRVHDDFLVLYTLEPGAFRVPVMHDDSTGAAYLSLVVSKRDPTPAEMGEQSLENERRMKQFTTIMEGLPVFSFEHLEKRLNLVVTDETWKKFFAAERAAAAEKRKGPGGQ